MPHAMVPLECVDPSCVAVGIVGPLENVVQERRATAVGKLVWVSGRWNGVGSEHTLHPFREGLRAGIELVQVLDDMGQVLDGSVVEIILRSRARETCRGVALKGRNGRRPAGVDLLVRKVIHIGEREFTRAAYGS